MSSPVKGILLHPACLPGRFGCGDLGPEAWQWIDVLSEAGVPAWVLPVHVEELNLLSFELLHHDGALLASDMSMLPVFDEVDVDNTAVHEVRWAFLHLAARRFVSQCEASPLLRRALEGFSDDESRWLDDAALFSALSNDQRGKNWHDWPDDLRTHKPNEMAAALVALEPQIEERKALHYMLSRQWRLLRAHARKAGVKLLALRRGKEQPSAMEGWAGNAGSLSDMRAMQHLDGILDPEDIIGEDWLDAAALFRQTPDSTWRFRWSQVNESVLRQLVSA